MIETKLEEYFRKTHLLFDEFWLKMNSIHCIVCRYPWDHSSFTYEQKDEEFADEVVAILIREKL